MAGCIGGQDDAYPVMCLATRAGNIHLSCPLGVYKLVLFWLCTTPLLTKLVRVKMQFYDNCFIIYFLTLLRLNR